MRLIDADEFKDYIIDSLEGYKLLTDEYRDFARDIIRGFLKDIDAQLTAYYIDKVIEQLEENYSCDVGNLKMISLDKSIEIVKGGQNERSVESC